MLPLELVIIRLQIEIFLINFLDNIKGSINIFNIIQIEKQKVFREQFYMTDIIHQNIHLPKEFKNIENLDNALNYFYSKEVQATDYSYLRFGQFIYNKYSIEYKNSYNIQDPYKAYLLLNEYLTNLK